MGFISWIHRWLCHKETKGTEFPKAKGYIIYTAEGGRFECVSQYVAATTLESLYNNGIKRSNIRYALTHKNGDLFKNKRYIATIKYKKEK